MRLSNSHETYGLVHQVLHWTTAGLILFMIPLGVFMHELPHETQMEIDFKVWLYSLHKSVGIAAFFVALVRIAWAALQPHPRLLNSGLEALAAQTIHFLLYALILLVPVFGWIHHAATDGFAPLWWWGFGDALPLVPKSENVAHFFGTAHWLAAIGLVLALVLHIGGAIKHAVKDKDQTLNRMVPLAYVETGIVPAGSTKSGKPIALTLLALFLGSVAVCIAHFGFGGDRAHDDVEQAEVTNAQSSSVSSKVGASINSNWVIDHQNSSLSVTVIQMGTPVKGAFGSFQVDVQFDPEKPQAGSIEARIATKSFEFGSNTDQALSSDFLNVGLFPDAVFISSDIVKTADGFRANGILSLLGREEKFAIDFTFEETQGVAKVEASAVIKRLNFGIGKSYKGNDTVGHDVSVNITLTAKQK